MNQRAPDNSKDIGRRITQIYAKAGFVSGLYTFLRLKLAPIIEVEKYVPVAGTILDFGCGNGMFAQILFLGSDQRIIKGVDVSARRIKTAQLAASGNSNLEFTEGDANSFPLEQCEAVTVVDLLHHMKFEEQKALLQKLHAGLSEGALVLIKDLEKAPRWKYLFHYMQDSLSYRSRLYFRSAEEMESDLREMGFEVQKISLAAGYMHPHVLYQCRKKSLKQKTTVVRDTDG